MLNVGDRVKLKNQPKYGNILQVTGDASGVDHAYVDWDDKDLTCYISTKDMLKVEPVVIFVRPTSCKCGGEQAILSLRPSGAEVMIGCTCHTTVQDLMTLIAPSKLPIYTGAYQVSLTFEEL